MFNLKKKNNTIGAMPANLTIFWKGSSTKEKSYFQRFIFKTIIRATVSTPFLYCKDTSSIARIYIQYLINSIASMKSNFTLFRNDTSKINSPKNNMIGIMAENLTSTMVRTTFIK